MNMSPVVRKLGNVSSIRLTDSFGETSEGVSAMIGTIEMFIPLCGMINVDEEIRKIESELEHQRGFLESVRKKLSNENFIAHAPAKVVETERKKESDSLAKIEAYEKALSALKNK